MSFYDWLIEIKKLSPASASKYNLVIKNRISDWLPSYEVPDNIIDFEALKRLIFSLDIYKERNKVGNNMYSSALNHYADYIREKDLNNHHILDEKQNLTSEAERKVKVRLIQAKFRKALFDVHPKCVISGVNKPSFLIASHIKPWKKSTDEERLDCFNGLLLTPNYDRLFDKGFISFKHSGELIISPILSEAEREFFRVPERIEFKFSNAYKPYLEFHRDQVFRSSN
ncbi:HNH endonuclease [Acinetobacter sp. B51(2017)]|uniref:HNH endonuclease n=1 Tax=Acinetobacter sp. B51(2017) TaxID=2060938 RepID=UPI000F09272E|nr:HNH endonuclease [Acinetobacter sp. B51(2017)]